MAYSLDISPQFEKMLALLPPNHRKVIAAQLDFMQENGPSGELGFAGTGEEDERLQVSVVEEVAGVPVELRYRLFYDWGVGEEELRMLTLVPLNFELEELYAEAPELRTKARLELLRGELLEERERHKREVERLRAEIARYQRWEDPTMTDWSAELEEILRQSRTEQVGYDFKQGFHELKPEGQFNEPLFRKVVRTLSAIANQGPFSLGYVIVGIADQPSDALRYQEVYPGQEVLDFDGFKITGIDSEVMHHYKGYDDYFSRIVQKLNAIKEVDTDFRKSLGQNLRLLRYRSKTLLVFRVKGTERPVFYADRVFMRIGPTTIEAKPRDLFELFRKF